MIKGLPEFEHSFELNVVGESTKKRFVGQFVYQRPNLRNISNIAKYKSQLDGDLQTIDSNVSMMHNMLSQLRFTLTTYPKWWEDADFGLELYDLNVLMDLYAEVAKFEKKFVESIPETVEAEIAKDAQKAKPKAE